MNRRYPELPMVGVGAVIFRGDSVLLVQRGKPPALGRWSIPGGLVELGESLRDAVQREVLEEVGLTVDVGELVAALDRVILDSEGRIEYHYVLLDFLCSSSEGQATAATDVTDCRFVSVDRLGEYDLTEGTREVILRASSHKGRRCCMVYDPAL